MKWLTRAEVEERWPTVAGNAVREFFSPVVAAWRWLRRELWLWWDNLCWWWKMYPQQGRLRRAISNVQTARECVERLSDTDIGAVRAYPSEQAIADAQRELVAAETRLSELLDWED